MVGRFRRGFTSAEKTEMWDRWQRGESLSSIGRAFGKAPEQIAGWLKRIRPGEESHQVSHETIYRSLFVQARGVLKKELMLHLRSQRTMRRPGPKKWQGDARGQIKDMVSIRERPASVEDRAVPCHWEGDLL